MATYKWVDVEMDEARFLADLTGIQFDLQMVINLCNRLLTTYSMERIDSELQEVLTIAILVKYSRPFASGVRSKLDILNVPGLAKEELEQHKIFIELRNKHISHSVNAFEDNKVVAYYNDEKVHDEGITSISVQHARLTSLGGYNVEKIINLSQKILDYINSKIKLEKIKVLNAVRDQQINEVLKRGTSAILANTDIKNVSKKRK